MVKTLQGLETRYETPVFSSVVHETGVSTFLRDYLPRF